MDHSNKLCHPAHDDEQQQQATCDSCCSDNSSIATRRAAAEIHGRYILRVQLHTRTSYSRVQLSSIVTICQVQVLCCETHTVPNQKSSEYKNGNKKKESSPDIEPSISFSQGGCNLLLNHPFPYMTYLKIGIYLYLSLIHI